MNRRNASLARIAVGGAVAFTLALAGAPVSVSQVDGDLRLLPTLEWGSTVAAQSNNGNGRGPQNGTGQGNRPATPPGHGGGNSSDGRGGGDRTNEPQVENGPSQHPSGNDRTNEPGGSGSQGNAASDPDGDFNYGVDQPGGAGGIDTGDQDGNNGCGNDQDFEDDNRGNCGGNRPGTIPAGPDDEGTLPGGGPGTPPGEDEGTLPGGGPGTPPDSGFPGVNVPGNNPGDEGTLPAGGPGARPDFPIPGVNVPGGTPDEEGTLPAGGAGRTPINMQSGPPALPADGTVPGQLEVNAPFVPDWPGFDVRAPALAAKANVTAPHVEQPVRTIKAAAPAVPAAAPQPVAASAPSVAAPAASVASLPAVSVATLPSTGTGVVGVALNSVTPLLVLVSSALAAGAAFVARRREAVS